MCWECTAQPNTSICCLSLSLASTKVKTQIPEPCVPRGALLQITVLLTEAQNAVQRRWRCPEKVITVPYVQNSNIKLLPFSEGAWEAKTFDFFFSGKGQTKEASCEVGCSRFVDILEVEHEQTPFGNRKGPSLLDVEQKTWETASILLLLQAIPRYCAFQTLRTATGNMGKEVVAALGTQSV